LRPSYSGDVALPRDAAPFPRDSDLPWSGIWVPGPRLEARAKAEALAGAVAAPDAGLVAEGARSVQGRQKAERARVPLPSRKVHPGVDAARVRPEPAGQEAAPVPVPPFALLVQPLAQEAEAGVAGAAPAAVPALSVRFWVRARAGVATCHPRRAVPGAAR